MILLAVRALCVVGCGFLCAAIGFSLGIHLYGQQLRPTIGRLRTRCRRLAISRGRWRFEAHQFRIWTAQLEGDLAQAEGERDRAQWQLQEAERAFRDLSGTFAASVGLAYRAGAEETRKAAGAMPSEADPLQAMRDQAGWN